MSISLSRKKVKRIVQGAYITHEAKAALTREAQRQDIFLSRFAAEILEKEAKLILRRESKDGKNLPTTET